MAFLYEAGQRCRMLLAVIWETKSYTAKQTNEACKVLVSVRTNRAEQETTKGNFIDCQID